MIDEQPQFHLVYLTGQPASGKTTVATLLERSVQPLRVFSYSELLREYINSTYASTVSTDELRRQSAHRIGPEDVAAVDQILIERVNQQRNNTHIIVDSHPVTKEDYGFRVTAFSVPVLQALAPTMICMLYTNSSVIRARLDANNEGRQPASEFETDIHRTLQSTVALIYGLTLAVPVYFLDSSRSAGHVVSEIARRLQARNPQTIYEPAVL